MHLGSGKNAINNMDKIKRADLHNNRKYKNNKNQEIDLSLSKYNITIVGTKNIVNDIKEFYKTEFGEALYNYNKKQQREDRKIIDYLEKMNNDTKSNIATEFIFQIGNAEDWENATMEDKQKTVEIFKKAIPILQEKNIKCFNASLHLDETSPHLHLLAVPVIENQTRGLEKQVSQNKVITLKVLNDIRKEVEKAFIEEYNKIYGTNKELKKGSEITEHLQVQDYKNTKKILEVAKKVKDKILLKEAVEQDYKNITNELTKLEKEKKDKKQKIKEIENDINNLSEIKKEFEEKKKIFDELETEVEKQNFKIERLQREKKTNETILFVGEDIVKGLTENINTAEEERKKLEKEKLQKEKEREEEQEKLDKLQKELNDRIEEQNRIKKEQQQILEKLENAEKSNAEKKKKLKEIEAENRDIQEKIENAESNKLSNSNKLTLLESEMQDLDNSYSEDNEALDKLKTFKKTLHNLQKNDDYVIQAKFKKLEMFRDTLNDVIDNVTVFAMHIKEAFKTIKNSLENGVEENTLVEDINSIISTELKNGMEDFNSHYEEKRKDKIKDTIEEIKEIEIEKDF
jgi:plasmid recombination enzyme